MRWTVRLRRHGGAQALQAKRQAQIARVRRLQQVSTDELLAASLAWLDHNPLRVLEAAIIEHLDDIERKTAG